MNPRNPKPRQTRDVLHVRGINPNVKAHFLGVVKRRKRTMCEVLEALMRVYVKQPGVINGWTREEVAALGDVGDAPA